MDEGSLYETDIVAWSDRQVAELRRLAAEAPSNSVDWKNPIEEIESVGRSQTGGVERKLVLLLMHLIKVVSAPDSPAMRGWRGETTSFQRIARKQFTDAMRQHLDPDEIWSDALKDAEVALLDWGDPIARNLPERNPFTVDELLAPDFNVERALEALSKAMSRGRTERDA